MNTQVACQYAIARFLPYAETGEFANVGVVLACPEANVFLARFAPVNRTQRITDFFDGLGARIYREALKYMVKEAQRLTDDVATGRVPARFAFEGATRPREALMTFGHPRVILASTPQDALDTLYNRFIERDFATKEYHEQMLTKGVGKLLAKVNLKSYFDDRAIGNDVYNVKFPFVSTHQDAPQVVIKPLFLAHDEPSKIYDHGGIWVTKIRRLKKHQLLPENTLFAADEATYDDNAKRRNAAREITAELRDMGVKVVPADDQAGIIQFANLAKPIY